VITITLPGEKIGDIATAAANVGDRGIVAPPASAKPQVTGVPPVRVELTLDGF
jgi:hypothetical protein